MRKRGKSPHIEYLVKWKGLPESEASRESEEALWQFKAHIDRFKNEDATGATREQVREDVMFRSVPNIFLAQGAFFMMLNRAQVSQNVLKESAMFYKALQRPRRH